MATNKAKYPSPSAQPWRVRACAPTQAVGSFPCTSFSFCLEDSRSFAWTCPGVPWIRGQKVWGPLCSSVSVACTDPELVEGECVVKGVAVGFAEVLPLKTAKLKFFSASKSLKN
jgi:hypothetical protein